MADECDECNDTGWVSEAPTQRQRSLRDLPVRHADPGSAVMLVEMPDTYGRHPSRAIDKRYSFTVVRLQAPDRTVTVWSDCLTCALDIMLDHERRSHPYFGTVVDWRWVATSNNAGSMRVAVKAAAR